LLGGPHRFGYTVGAQFAGGGSGLFKHDYVTGSREVAALDAGLLLGEMSFVPNPAARAEDDGILMGFGYHRDSDEGQLLLLDAQTLERVAIVHLPQRVPMGFHGNWAPTG
jgi:carotenoid cleavage dioxygenase